MKEYFTTSYEEKRKANLIKLSEQYDKLLSTYKAYNPNDVRDAPRIVSLENDIKNYSKTVINELNKSADMIEQQIKLYEEKLTELDSLRTKLINTETNNNDINTFNINLSDTQQLNNNYTRNNLILFIICCILIIVLIILNMM